MGWARGSVDNASGRGRIGRVEDCSRWNRQSRAAAELLGGKADFGEDRLFCLSHSGGSVVDVVGGRQAEESVLPEVCFTTQELRGRPGLPVPPRAVFDPPDSPPTTCVVDAATRPSHSNTFVFEGVSFFLVFLVVVSCRPSK
jgi:hypothetical protein